MRLPALYAVLDAEVAAAHGWTLPALARAVLAGGARLLQVRAKTLPSGELLAISRSVVAEAAAAGAVVIVNDRADVALAAGAGGVHVGQDDLSPSDARRIVGPERLVGISTHTSAQVAAACDSDADYIAVGPVFGTRTKQTGYDPVGFERVGEAAATGRPVVAIGGITLDNAASVLAAGATSVAVISDLLAGDDPEARTRALVERLEPPSGL